jgi:hypothetical protein
MICFILFSTNSIFSFILFLVFLFCFAPQRFGINGIS